MPGSSVVAVSRDEEHRFSKVRRPSITLLPGLGVAGDAHAGELVQHRSRVRRDPSQPNLRQVHLLPSELFATAAEQGYGLSAGDLGENVLTTGLDLLTLPTGTLLGFGDGPERAVVRVTGLRNPCGQINDFRPGLLKVVLARADGTPMAQPAAPTGTAGAGLERVIRKAGVMAVVEHGGEIRPGMAIHVRLPSEPYLPLAPV